MLADALQDVDQVGVGIDAVEPAGDDQALDDADVFGAQRGGAGFSDTGISNGMDAPAWRGIKCAKVEVSSDHLNQQERPR